MDEFQKNQLQHKKVPRDIEFYDEHGSPVTYRIQHDDIPNDTCNDFCPIHCQQGNDNKVLRFHNDGENATLNSLSNEFPTATIQSTTDCFRLGKTINQFRRLCPHSTQSLSSARRLWTYIQFDQFTEYQWSRRRTWRPSWPCWYNYCWRWKQPNMWNKHTCRPLQIVHSQSSPWCCPGKNWRLLS